MASHRYYFASQHRWEQNHGFYLSFENSTDEPVCRLETLRLILGVGSGKGWRYLSLPVRWQQGVRYTVRAEIHPDRARLRVGEQTVEESIDGFAPVEGSLTIGEVPPLSLIHI